MTEEGLSAREALCAICGYDPWDLPDERGITADPLAWLLKHKNKGIDLWNDCHRLHKDPTSATRAWEQSARDWEAKLRRGVGVVSRADLELLDRIGKHPPLSSLPEHHPYYKPIPKSLAFTATGEAFDHNHLLWRLDALLERVKEIEQNWRRDGISEEVVQVFYEPLYKVLRADDWYAVGYETSGEKSGRIPADYWEFLRINETGASGVGRKFNRVRFFQTPISNEMACLEDFRKRLARAPRGETIEKLRDDAEKKYPGLSKNAIKGLVRQVKAEGQVHPDWKPGPPKR